jgi:hypothetical protein
VKIVVDHDPERAGLLVPGLGKKILADKEFRWTRNEWTVST